MKLNENNIQAPFQYRIRDKTFELKTVSGGFSLNADNVQVKIFSGERLFCADIGYTVDGAVEEMEFLIDSIKVYPQVLETLEDLNTVQIKDNEVYLIRNELDFKSIVFFPPIDLNKKFDFTVTTYSSTFSSFMFDDIAKKLNGLDINYPIKNYYESVDYKINDIIKNNGYLYRVFKDFTSDSTDYYLKTNCDLLTPFKKLELNNIYKSNELVEYNDNFLIVQKDFRYESKDGVLTNLNGLLKPLQDIIIWFDEISRIYKNQIIIRDNILYKVLEDIENPVWNNIQSQLERLIKAENTFYDDSNSSFGNNTNTVQKAIEKLKSSKQDSLILGNNISLNGNTINVNGGTSKEYIIGNNYYIYDLIIYNSKLYKANENFTAIEWSTDRAKLSLISSGGGGSNDAADVSYDNTNTNLEYISGYDFPKFKTPIADTINLVLITGKGDIPATITKQSDGSYRLNLSAQTYQSTIMQFIIKSIEGQSEVFNIYTILAQFFEIEIFKSIEEINYFNLEADECVISEIDSPLKAGFALTFSSSQIALAIARQDDTPISTGNYNISLNVKNRVLRNHNSNLFCLTTNANNQTLESLVLENDNGITKIKGSISNLGQGTISGFYIFNNIIPNYFALDGNYISTSGITSSSGKSVKYNVITTNTSNGLLYNFALQYTDGSSINQGDVFTFNLTPDKNVALDPIYSEVTNVQDAIEAVKTNIDTANSNISIINSKMSSLNATQISFNDTNTQLGAANVQQAIETIVNNKIPDVYDYSGKETLTNKIAIVNGVRKQVYRVYCERNLNLSDSIINQQQTTVLELRNDVTFFDVKRVILVANGFSLLFPCTYLHVQNTIVIGTASSCNLYLDFVLEASQLIAQFTKVTYFLEYYR
ncbi:phage tail protein [Brachyspira hampsonii]|uniref:Phage tail protein n=1 Tax=Brachyspira hampsonii TaxID=1287055 RepID=A0A1E5NI18_9SPIR|nr:phage tail protein [Brachyspira hampsonii]OEJ15766.1 phage tail protein [Brachyspira hampsonii]